MPPLPSPYIAIATMSCSRARACVAVDRGEGGKSSGFLQEEAGRGVEVPAGGPRKRQREFLFSYGSEYILFLFFEKGVAGAPGAR